MAELTKRLNLINELCFQFSSSFDIQGIQSYKTSLSKVSSSASTRLHRERDIMKERKDLRTINKEGVDKIPLTKVRQEQGAVGYAVLMPLTARID
jgi:hypothetical protein